MAWSIKYFPHKHEDLRSVSHIKLGHASLYPQPTLQTHGLGAIFVWSNYTTCPPALVMQLLAQSKAGQILTPDTAKKRSQ